MKVGYVSRYDARDVNYWSGLSTYISCALENQGIDLNYLGPLVEKNKLLFQIKQGFYKYFLGKKHLRDYEPRILQNFGEQIRHKLNGTTTDVVFSATASPISYLECRQPIVFWADAVFASLVDFYPFFSNLSAQSIAEGNAAERAALERCELAIYASDWAAEAAISNYGVRREKVKVVPFGANISVKRNLNDIKIIVNARATDCCKLLFLGVEWERKGGEIALETTRLLNENGLRTELTVAGCEPNLDASLKKFVNIVGFVNKATRAGRKQIDRLLCESHFLIVPSQAECYGIVFCEANSFGVPSISTRVGGIPTVIKNNVNGRTFDLDAKADCYSEYIHETFADYSNYRRLAVSSFHEYESRLNWNVAGRTVKNLLRQCA